MADNHSETIRKLLGYDPNATIEEETLQLYLSLKEAETGHVNSTANLANFIRWTMTRRYQVLDLAFSIVDIVVHGAEPKRCKPINVQAEYEDENESTRDLTLHPLSLIHI